MVERKMGARERGTCGCNGKGVVAKQSWRIWQVDELNRDEVGEHTFNLRDTEKDTDMPEMGKL